MMVLYTIQRTAEVKHCVHLHLYRAKGHHSIFDSIKGPAADNIHKSISVYIDHGIMEYMHTYIH